MFSSFTKVYIRNVCLKLLLSEIAARSGPSKTLFVKNLSYDTTEEDLKEAIDGAVAARVIMDRETGKSKGQVFFNLSLSDLLLTGLTNY
jgi:RNA recognition motif. (a.k.a. RRM, RBD, or RNP domain)